MWVDQFGVHVNRTLWITFLQLGVPLGTMIGYVMEAYFIRSFDDVMFINLVERLFLYSDTISISWSCFICINS